jgi:phenylalanyl-tRNA synthetase beta subunit
MLVKSIDSNVDYKKVSKYPKMDRDVAFFVPTDFSVQEASSLLKSISLESVTEVKLFDIYKVNSEQSAGREGALGCKVNSEQSAGREGALGSKDMENNRKSFAFKIIFQSEDRTLSDEFANEQMEKVYGVLNKNGFEIR